MEVTNIRSRSDLLDYLNQDQRVKYIFFWGHQKPRDDNITKSCFSQWYDAPFYKNELFYKTAEHYMMAAKARLFNDVDSEQRIIASSTPGEAKKLGRHIKSFDDEVWNQHRFNIVVEANLAKFQRHKALKTYLLSTDQRVLVEASPQDKIWGIGLDSNHNDAEQPRN